MIRLPPAPVGALLAISVAALTLLFAPQSAFAENTRVKVTVLSKDAKFIGSSMGGVSITLEDADSGELLASGVTAGTTGDTGRIILDDRERGRPLSTSASARFVTELALEQPRRIRFTAYGPLAQRQSANRVSATQWVVPGRHLDAGDGLMLVMPGFAVDVLAPPAHVRLETPKGEPLQVALRANVIMMCGCPLQPGGLWDSNQFEIIAQLRSEGQLLDSQPMRYAGDLSQFETTLTVSQPGWYEVTVYAYDPANGNTGLDRATFAVVGS